MLLPNKKRSFISNLKLLAITAMAVTLGGCATAYDKQATASFLSKSIGFSVSQLQTDVFRVSFKGGLATPRTKVDDFTFLRAAETILKNGFTYFQVIDSDARTARIDGTLLNNSGSGGFSYGLGFPQNMAIKTLYIRGFTEKPKTQAVCFNAVEVRDRLMAQYGLIASENEKTN